MDNDSSIISISWGGFLPRSPFFLGSIGILNKITNKNYYTYWFSLIIILFRIKMRHKTIKKWESWKMWEWDSRKWSKAHVRVLYLKVKTKAMFGLPNSYHPLLNFHHPSLTFSRTHTFCACLALFWFLTFHQS